MPWEGGEWGRGEKRGLWGSWGGSARGGGLKKGIGADRSAEEVEESGEEGFGSGLVDKWCGAARKRKKTGPVRLLGFPMEERKAKLMERWN